MRKIRYENIEAETERAIRLDFGFTQLWFPKTTQDGRHISSLADGKAIRVEDWYFKKNFQVLSDFDSWRC